MIPLCLLFGVMRKKRREEKKQIILYPNSSFCDVHAAIACCIPIAECCNATNKIVPAAMQCNRMQRYAAEQNVRFSDTLMKLTQQRPMRSAFAVYLFIILVQFGAKRSYSGLFQCSHVYTPHTYIYIYIDVNV